MREPLREHLARTLGWHDAHLTFEQAVAGIPEALRGTTAPGIHHTLWQLVEHIRLGQLELLGLCADPHHARTRTWPDDYWPDTAAPADTAAWDASIAACVRDRAVLAALVSSERFELFPAAPSGKPAYTGLRAILLAIDHTSYHVGQIVSLRQALGIWTNG